MGGTVFETVKDASAPRVLARAERDLSSSKVELVEQGQTDITLLINGIREVWICEDSWDCDCSSPMDPCHHVLIGVLAFEQQLFSVPSKTSNGFLRYKLLEDDDGIILRRVWVVNNREELFAGQGHISEFDRSIHRLFFRNLRKNNLVIRERVRDLLNTLSSDEATSVTFNHTPIKTSGKLAGPVAMVQNHPKGYVLRLARDPKIQQIFKGGVVLYDGELRKFDRILENLSYEHLAKGIIFRSDEVESLVCEAIPNLKEKIPVYCLAKDLPEAVNLDPYIRIDTIGNEYGTSSVQSLEVSVNIVYGDPPIAIVHNQQLNREGKIIPVRRVYEESRLINVYRLLKNASLFPLNITKEFSINQIPKISQALKKMTAHPDIMVTGFATSIALREEIIPDVEVSDDDLTVDWQGADSKDIFTAWSNNQEYILLRDGSLRPMPQDWLQENGSLLRELLLTKENAGNRLPSFALFDLAKLCEKLNHPPPANLDNIRVLTGDFNGIPETQIPLDLKATLRDYQTEGFHWLSFLKRMHMGGILADAMGLGKTVQALCILEHQSLVVAPTSVLHNWISETNKFRPTLSICLYHGTGRVFDPSADIILTSYAILRNDIERLQAIPWRVVVLDEAQAIKNPKSLTAQAAFKLQSDFRLTLTGTPVENRLTELWSQIHFLCPGLLGGHNDFIRQYEQPITEGQNLVAQRLRTKIKPFVLRRLKKDVAPELPPRTDQILYCTLSNEERNVYDAVRYATQQDIVRQLDEGRFNVMNALEALLRLRQAACHQALLPEQEATTSSKVQALVEKLQEVTNSGHKALVFSQWTSLLDLIEPHLNTHGIRFVRLDGSTRDRKKVVDTFQTEANIPIFLSSLKAGGVGLNLTEADHVFLVDPWWNPAVEDQAADRAHRIGQTKSVIVYRLVTQNTVEERILLLQDRKRLLAETALGEANSAAAITQDDLLELLK